MAGLKDTCPLVQALGLKPKVVKDKIQPHLDGREMKQLMEGGQEEADGAAERDPADMIKGVGYVRYIPFHLLFASTICQDTAVPRRIVLSISY